MVCFVEIEGVVKKVCAGILTFYWQEFVKSVDDQILDIQAVTVWLRDDISGFKNEQKAIVSVCFAGTILEGGRYHSESII